jgi:hypothetical protein
VAYADDVIMGRRLQDVEAVFTSLVEQTRDGIRNRFLKKVNL